MSETTLNLTTTDGHRITGTLFCPDTPGAVLVISHGMAEHGNRYAGLARWLGTRGVAVVTYHHRGHGPDCRPEDLGHYADHQGWQDRKSTRLNSSHVRISYAVFCL